MACISIAQELAERFRKLKVDRNHRRWKSFRQALKTVWSKESIDALRIRLSMFQSEMIVHILVDVRSVTKTE